MEEYRICSVSAVINKLLYIMQEAAFETKARRQLHEKMMLDKLYGV